MVTTTGTPSTLDSGSLRALAVMSVPDPAPKPTIISTLRSGYVFPDWADVPPEHPAKHIPATVMANVRLPNRFHIINPPSSPKID